MTLSLFFACMHACCLAGLDWTHECRLICGTASYVADFDVGAAVAGCDVCVDEEAGCKYREDGHEDEGKLHLCFEGRYVVVYDRYWYVVNQGSIVRATSSSFVVTLRKCMVVFAD